MLSMKEIAELPESVMEKMLQAEGAVVAEAHKKSIRAHGLYKSGLLESSITVHPKMRRGKDRQGGQERYVLVYPRGAHQANPSGADSKKTSNNDVGFVHEFGAPKRNIKATQWMSKANAQSIDAAVSEAEKIYNNWLKSKGL